MALENILGEAHLGASIKWLPNWAWLAAVAARGIFRWGGGQGLKKLGVVQNTFGSHTQKVTLDNFSSRQ